MGGALAGQTATKSAELLFEGAVHQKLPDTWREPVNWHRASTG